MGVVSWVANVTRWYPRDMPRDERRLVFKLDWMVLAYACLAFFTKYLDVSALSNAYVSGMKEDLQLTGNKLNYISAAYEVGYVVFQIPSNLLVTRIPAQYYLPSFEIFWGLFTLGTAFVTSYKQLVVLRFFVGLSATSCYIGCLHVVNSWYKKSELGRRNALFWMANPIATMFGGYLQAAAYKNLDDRHGLQGWRWLFVICSIITIPIALLGFFVFPDIPERTNTRWLTDAEKDLARTRLEGNGFKASRGINRTLLKRVFRRWETYAFAALGGWTGILSYGASTPFLLWLKSQPHKYSIPKVNTLGTVTSAISVASALLVAFYSDITGRRWDSALLAGFLMLFTNSVLAGWTVPYGLKFFSYILLGACHGVQPSIITWTAETLSDDMELRSIMIAVENVVAEINYLLVPLAGFQVSKAPRFRGGFIWSAATTALWLILCGAITLIQHQKRTASSTTDEPENPPPPIDETDNKEIDDTGSDAETKTQSKNAPVVTVQDSHNS
ncbi:pantothenate transporter [Xylona heveae TC161]|uniref:Pantothenate transporter n=1 Tax=Xylona heveae (strain CBS 132557 / TC161) TaxID=1328760 RepID=A0A165AF48_XYLHT|nr:pantothenate transporter [Xylona heveae TC161]KZF20374.1 pantothenate transporter [Xylona heveae TC161]